MSWFDSIRPRPTAEAQNLLVPDRDEQEGEPVEVVQQEAPPAVMPNYDATHADDEDDKAMDKAINALRGKEWAEDDLKFYFQQVEIKMKSAGVKSNFTKLQVLSTILPKKVTDEIKGILCKQESEFTRKDAYLQAKNEIIRCFGPCEGANCERALNRVLTGKPSQLAKALIGDLCSKELNGCCCIQMVGTLWRRALPSSVKQAVAHYEFKKATLNDVLQVADDVFMSTKPPTATIASIASPAATPIYPVISASDGLSTEEVLNQGFRAPTLPPLPPEQAAQIAQVAHLAAIYNNYNRGSGRGRGSSNRGNNRGRGRGGQGQGGGQQQYSAANPRWRTPRHPDLPPFGSCKRHWQFGKSSFVCLEPQTCPWKQHIQPKPQN